MLNKKYQSAPSAIASYDYVDIAAGTGITNFYAGDTVDLKLLSNQQFYSDNMFLSGSTGGEGSAVKVIDADFDVQINRPLTIGGKVVINVPLRVNPIEGGASPSYAIIKLRKWDGAAETEIASNQSSTYSPAVGDTWSYKMLAVDLTIPDTIFKVGEYIRLTVEGWGSSPATNCFINIAHDPMNRTTNGAISPAANDWDTTKSPSTLIFQVPQRLDL